MLLLLQYALGVEFRVLLAKDVLAAILCILDFLSDHVSIYFFINAQTLNNRYLINNREDCVWFNNDILPDRVKSKRKHDKCALNLIYCFSLLYVLSVIHI